MGTLILRVVAGILGLLGLALILFLWLAPPRVDAGMNPVVPHAPYEVSEEARALHATIPVADLHADSLLWQRDLLKRNDYGHVDIPRLREGGVFLQMFTAVTKTPKGQNYDENDGSTDNIRTLAMAQRWPRRTWDSRTERAIYQAEKLAAFAEEDGFVRIIRTCKDLSELATFEPVRRQAVSREMIDPDGIHIEEKFGKLDLWGVGPWPNTCGIRTPINGPVWTADRNDLAHIAAILGTEGSHALDGDLANIDRLFDVGYRVMGLHHFFDNKLGGSLHGTSGEGLTEFGRAAVTRMREKDIIIDVAHSSEQVVRDVLAMGAGPLIVSHTGFDGHCPSPRNISDELMAEIAADGGLIGVGFWEDVTCDASPRGIADAMMYGASRFGVDHIALGSDFDGTVTTELDASELAAITQALMDAGMPDDDIRKVMGGNTVRFFLENLPEG